MAELVLYLRQAQLPQGLTAGPLRHFLRANLDRKRQIWPAIFGGLHYVRPHSSLVYQHGTIL